MGDIDSIHMEYAAKNIVFVGKIGDREYGSRDFRIRDNNGNMLILSSPLVNQKDLLDNGRNQ